jgi:hypothetical protein
MSGWGPNEEDLSMRPGDFDGTTDDRPVGGFTGEWIVRVPGLLGPVDADRAWDRIIEAVKGTGLSGVEVVFDRSRWKGGDF